MTKILIVASAMVAIATTAPQAMESTPKPKNTLIRSKFSSLREVAQNSNPVLKELMQSYLPLLQRKYGVSLILERTGLSESPNEIAKLLNKYAHTPEHHMNYMDDRTVESLFEELLKRDEKRNLIKSIKVPFLHFVNGETEGFNFNNYEISVNFRKYDSNGIMKEPICGYDRKKNEIVPIRTTVQHTVCRGIMSACYQLQRYLFETKENRVFASLFGEQAEIYKTLWKSDDSLASAEENLFAISGAHSVHSLCPAQSNDILASRTRESCCSKIYKFVRYLFCCKTSISPATKLDGLLSKEIEYSPESEQLFDFHDNPKDVFTGNFIPPVFSVTYKQYEQIRETYHDVNLLRNIDKTITPHIEAEEKKKNSFCFLKSEHYNE
ncbi:MAG: hypothetical protein IJS10_00820 [Alphaproteobacteria bacterium]|nr:hypothetical protein [Alphaproteobacteria bacterium]